jgi:hypothetical protein
MSTSTKQQPVITFHSKHITDRFAADRPPGEDRPVENQST